MMDFDVTRIQKNWLNRGFCPEIVDLAAETFDVARFAGRYFTDGRGRPWRVRDYQMPSLRSLSPRKVHQDGRDVGKTSEIEIVVCWAMTVLPGIEMLVATQCENHLYPLMERLVRRFETIPAFKLGLVERRRSPSYCLRFKNGSILWGRIAGPRGINFQGLHVDWQFVDEAQEMTETGWGELYQSLNAGGWRWVYGVPNGWRKTYYRMTHMTEYEQHRWPSSLNPGFTESKRLELVKLYGGEESEGYIHRVLGRHGAPSMAAFRFDDYLDCVDDSVEFIDSTITSAMLREHAIEDLVPAPSGRSDRSDFYLGVDLGYTRDPSELVVYADKDGRMTNVARVHMEKVDYHTQQRVIEMLDERYGFRGIGIDAGNNGRAVTHALRAVDARWDALVDAYDFGANILVGYSADGVPQYRKTKRFMTELIERRMQERAVIFPKLADRENQYVAHTYRTGSRGEIIYSKGNDHIIDADRCALLRQYMAHAGADNQPEKLDLPVRFDPV
ncbi:MAG: hypothetical protein J7M12_05665 [Candidatus Hydrogenedentes bacterium]|nr:hypothetical protein [Candidatus Hydrogenedentota bacterium]